MSTRRPPSGNQPRPGSGRPAGEYGNPRGNVPPNRTTPQTGQNPHPRPGNGPAPTRRVRNPAPDAFDAQHPGEQNYPATPRRPASSGYLPPRTHNPHLPPLPPTAAFEDDQPDDIPETGKSRRRKLGDEAQYSPPEKVTVVRVIGRRSQYLTQRGLNMVHRAATADGADRSGLTQLTVPVVLNFMVDAAMAVALANTLFFAAATGDSKVSVALYLALTVAPFAVIAPVIGPLLDRLQHGRRLAMASTFGLRAVLALLIIVNSSYDDSGQLTYKPWVLYPCALGLMVLSKSFGVLKSAVAPRVLPPSIDLVRVNSRLTTFGLIGGTIVGGGIAGLFEMVLGKGLHLPGAMIALFIAAAAGIYYCMRIPKWVEVTAGEVPTTLTYRADPNDTELGGGRGFSKEMAAKLRQPLGRTVVTGLWGNGTIRILTGFLTLFVAFYAKAQDTGGSAWKQLAMLGAVGAAAGVGNALGNGVGTRIQLKNPLRIIVLSTAAVFVVSLACALMGNLWMVILAGFTGSATSAVAKVCLDSSIQDDLPDESRASAFGRSETVLQLCWVLGASLGVGLPPELWLGFTVVTVLVGLGLAQTIMTSRGSTLVPGFGGRRPTHAAPTVAFAAQPGAARK